MIVSSSRLSESAPCSGCWVSCPSLFSAPFSGSIFHLLLHKEILFFLLPIAGAFLTICFDQTLAVDSVPPRAAFISSLPPLSIKQIFSKSYRAGYSLLKHVFCCLNWLFSRFRRISRESSGVFSHDTVIALRRALKGAQNWTKSICLKIIEKRITLLLFLQSDPIRHPEPKNRIFISLSFSIFHHVPGAFDVTVSRLNTDSDVFLSFLSRTPPPLREAKAVG